MNKVWCISFKEKEKNLFHCHEPPHPGSCSVFVLTSNQFCFAKLLISALLLPSISRLFFIKRCSEEDYRMNLFFLFLFFLLWFPGWLWLCVLSTVTCMASYMWLADFWRGCVLAIWLDNMHSCHVKYCSVNYRTRGDLSCLFCIICVWMYTLGSSKPTVVFFSSAYRFLVFLSRG